MADEPSMHHSYSSPTLSSKAKLKRTQSFEDQIRVFADKFVDLENNMSMANGMSLSPTNQSSSESDTSITSIWYYNTLYCRHRHSCFQDCWARGVVRTFAAAYSTRTTWSIVSNVLQIKWKNVHWTTANFKKFFRSVYLDLNSLRFALGLTILAFTYKFSLCFIFRRLIHKLLLIKNDFVIKYIYPALSGFIAGMISLNLIKNKSTRNIIALYCIVRAISDALRVYQHTRKSKNDNESSYLYFENITFILFQIPLMYAFIHEPKSMNKTYFQWILNMGALTPLQMHLLRIFMKYPKYGTGGKYDDFPLLSCNPVFHEKYENCYKEHAIDWCYGIFRAARIYIPVHWLPTILLTPKKIIQNPIKYIKVKTINTLRSSIFLSTYQHNMKLTECIGRKVLNSDIGLLSMSGGVTAGLAILIEHPSRRSEIVLYVIPRAVEVFINHIPERFTIFSHNLIPTVVFSMSLALWMAIRQCPGVITVKDKREKQKHKKHVANELNQTVLSVIFGRFH